MGTNIMFSSTDFLRIGKKISRGGRSNNESRSGFQVMAVPNEKLNLSPYSTTFPPLKTAFGI